MEILGVSNGQGNQIQERFSCWPRSSFHLGTPSWIILWILLIFNPISRAESLDSTGMDRVLRIWDIQDQLSVTIDKQKSLTVADVISTPSLHSLQEPYDPSAIYWLKIPLQVSSSDQLLMHTGNIYFEVFLQHDGVIRPLIPDRFRVFHFPAGDSLLIIRSSHPNNPFHTIAWMKQDQWNGFFLTYVVQSTAFRAIMLAFALYNLIQFLFGARFYHLWYAFNQIGFVLAVEGSNCFFLIVWPWTVSKDLFIGIFLLQSMSSIVYGCILLGWKNISRWTLFAIAVCAILLVIILGFAFHIEFLAPLNILICGLLLIMVWTAYYRRRGHTLFAAIGWTAILFAYIQLSAHDMGWLVEYNEFFGYALIATESGFYSIAMGKEKQDRIVHLLSENQKSLKDSEKLRQSLADLNKDLERKVEERTRDIQVILRNIRQGLFQIIDYRLNVGPFHSPFLRDLLGFSQDSSFNVREAFFSALDFTPDLKNQLNEALKAIIGEKSIAFEFNQGHLPRRIRLLAQGRVKTVEISWDPVLDEHGIVEQIIVSIRDMTEFQEMESEAQRMQTRLGTLTSLVHAGRPIVTAFLRRWLEFCRDMEHIDFAVIDRSAFCDTLFLNLHTFKGAARSVELRDLAALIHEQEEALKEERSGINRADAILARIVRPLEDQFKYILYLAEVNLGWSIKDNLVEIDRQRLTDFILHFSQKHASSAEQRLIDDLAHDIFHKLEDCIRNLTEEAGSLARRLEKKSPRLTIRVHDRVLSDKGRSLLYGIWPHLLANALDHGIESPAERLAKGKTPDGEIIISSDDDYPCVLYFGDDGRGLDLKKLETSEQGKALALEKCREISKQEIAELILIQGLSTRDTLSEISGRGVGLSAVAQQLRETGGKLEIELLDILENEQQGNQRFRFRLTLPESSFCFPAVRV